MKKYRLVEKESLFEKEREEYLKQIQKLEEKIKELTSTPDFEREMLDELIFLREGYYNRKALLENDNSSGNKTEIIAICNDIVKQIETILFNYDVEMSHSNPSDKYNFKKHQASKIIPTDDETKNGLIVESFGELYIYKGEILHKECVSVFKFQPTENN